jgi:DNA replication protein DnaC
MSEPTPLRDVLTGFLGTHEALPVQTCRVCRAEFRDARSRDDALCWDCEEKGHEAYAAKANAAHEIGRLVPPEYENKTFERFLCPPGDPEARGLVREWTPGQRGLYLWSDQTGCGKSHLAYALVQREILAGRRVVALEWTDFLGRIKATFNRKFGGETEHEVEAQIEGSDLVVLDDVGAGRVTEWSTEKLWSLVNARYLAKKPIVITSNYGLPMLRRLLGKPDGDRIASRIENMCRVVHVSGGDFRTPTPERR